MWLIGTSLRWENTSSSHFDMSASKLTWRLNKNVMLRGACLLLFSLRLDVHRIVQPDACRDAQSVRTKKLKGTRNWLSVIRKMLAHLELERCRSGCNVIHFYVSCRTKFATPHIAFCAVVALRTGGPFMLAHLLLALRKRMRNIFLPGHLKQWWRSLPTCGKHATT